MDSSSLLVIRVSRNGVWPFSSGSSYYELGRESLSAFSHVDTSDLHPPTREGGGEVGVYRVSLRVYRNNFTLADSHRNCQQHEDFSWLCFENI